MAYINRLIELNSNCILLVEQQLNILNQLINMNGNINITNGTLNNILSSNTTNNTILNEISNKTGYSIQSGSFVLNNEQFNIQTRWFDVSKFIYIVCYYKDTITGIILPDIKVEFSLTNDANAIIINPNITITPIANDTFRYGILLKTDVPGINYMRLITPSDATINNIFFCITGVE